jgi:hypothetical protein
MKIQLSIESVSIKTEHIIECTADELRSDANLHLIRWEKYSIRLRRGNKIFKDVRDKLSRGGRVRLVKDDGKHHLIDTDAPVILFKTSQGSLGNGT